ncbi:hypothetical protein EB118_08290 [bacterium]|nr:hypothetical protein [bacterium]NDC95302.1 hypothetical protein [bacterium]NDD85041.1 hypothetical protein [bacterium]NDG30065.1 hypothetical protein [bacterium]
MSHPDPLYDPENSYEDDDMIVEDENYDDYEDFYHDDDDSYDDSMDGDHESAFGSCGWGVDEYYNDTPMYDDYYGGE